MRFVFSTGSLYSYAIERAFSFAAKAGFDGVELMVDQRWETLQPDHVRRLSDAHQLPVVAVHSPFSPVVPGWPADEVGRLERSVALAEGLGAAVVVHHLPRRVGQVAVQAGARRLVLPVPGWTPDRSYDAWLDDGYVQLQARTDVALCIENMPALRFLGRRWNAHRRNTVVAWARFPALTLDTTHLATWGVDAADVYRRVVDRVRHVHLSNFDGREHRRPEIGRLRLDRLLAGLASHGYAGVVSLELHPDALDAGAPDGRVIELMTASLERCRAWARVGA